jgi:hypothetical protein
MNGKPGSKRPGRVPRTSAGRIVAAISLAAALVAAGLPATRGAEAQAKPSIVLVLADDMPTSLVAATPNLRSLVAQGATFTAANDQRPLCGPACAALLTGRYAQNSGVATNSHADRCGRGEDHVAPGPPVPPISTGGQTRNALPCSRVVTAATNQPDPTSATGC